MKKYRKRTPIVEAVLFDPAGEHRNELPGGIRGDKYSKAKDWSHDLNDFWIRANAFAFHAVIPRMEYIVTTPNGHVFTVWKDKFEREYEPIASNK